MAAANPSRGLNDNDNDDDYRRVRHRRVTVNGVDTFYREAGPPGAPAVLLLHGFPSSSHEFRHLIPALADRFRLVAPDLPGFGFSAFPDAAAFRYTFDGFADHVDAFRRQLGLTRFALYLHDYGAHVGYRLAMRNPGAVTAIACQNAEAYDDGFDHEPLKAYWRDPSPENLNRLAAILTTDGTREEFVGGLPADQMELVSPETWALHWPLIDRPGNREVQLGLFADYRTNVELRPAIHAYFRTHRPPALIVWGRHEIYYTTAAAEAYRRDLPDAEVHVLDAGHWALETHTAEVVELVRDFLTRRLQPEHSPERERP